jgi:hypothetical protein
MNTDTFMVVVLVGAIVVMGVSFLLRTIARRYPDTALVGFKSPAEIGDYFGFAMDVLAEHRWLKRVPILLALSAFIVKWPVWFYTRAKLVEHGDPFVSGWLTNMYREPLTLVDTLNTLALAPLELNRGYAEFVGLSVVVWAVALHGVLFYKPTVARLRRYAGGGPARGLAFVEETLSILRLAILLVGIPLSAAFILVLVKTALPLGVVLMGLFAITFVLVSTIVAGFLFFYLKAVLDGGEIDRRAAFRSGLGIARPLFFLNLVLGLGFAIPVLLTLPNTVAGWLAAHVGGPLVFYSSRLEAISSYCIYFPPVLAVCILCAPFVLVWKPEGLRATLRANFDFIGRHFIKYLTLVGLGTLLLSLPYHMTNIIIAVFGFFTIPELIGQAVVDILLIYLAVVFFIVIFAFFYDYFPEATPAEPSDRPEPAPAP